MNDRTQKIIAVLEKIDWLCEDLQELEPIAGLAWHFLASYKSVDETSPEQVVEA